MSPLSATTGKLPSIEDRGQTDRVTVLANPGLDFQSPASYGHDSQSHHRHAQMQVKGQLFQS